MTTVTTFNADEHHGHAVWGEVVTREHYSGTLIVSNPGEWYTGWNMAADEDFDQTIEIQGCHDCDMEFREATG